MHNDNFIENGRLVDSVGASLVITERLLEKMDAPALVYDVECIGPDEKSRDEYIALICAARRARDAGRFLRADEIEKEAELLLNSKWKEHVHNTVMVPGKTSIIDTYFKGSSYTATWYMLLVGGSATIANTDTLASHPGWTEQTPYSGNRPTISWGTTASGSNTATTQVISINATATVAGAGIASVSSGTSGILYSATNFTTARGVANGDTLNITPTVSVS